MKKLYCHEDLLFDGEVYAKNGKTYDIVEESFKYYDIVNEVGKIHSFTKDEDEYGQSYKMWFNLIESKEETNTEKLIKVLIEEIEELKLDMTYCRNDVSIDALESAIANRKNTIIGLQKKLKSKGQLY